MIKPTPPQMPDVLMVEPITLHTCFVDDFKDEQMRGELLNYTSYTRTDLCEELRAALRDCVQAFNAEDGVHSSAYYRRLRTATLTKAQGLLR